MSAVANNVHNIEAWQNRTGANRLSDAEEFDQAITDLARVIGLTAIESELTTEYSKVVGHLVKARRELRAAFGMERA